MRDLAGKVAIITGAAGGIGTEVAKLFDRRGMQLVLTDVNAGSLQKTARLLSREPLCLTGDITIPDEVRNLIHGALQRFKQIDILVNNAGIILPALFEDCAYADIDKQVRVNLLGTMACTHAVIPVMRGGGGGHIVTVSSMAGIVPETYSAVYTATKFALRGFNLALNIELKRHHIGVSTIFPDSVLTPMLRYEADHGGSPITFLDTPLVPGEVARAILKAILKEKAEVYVPTSTGLLSKAVMCWPWAVTKIWPVLEKLGARNKAAVEKKLRETLPE